MTTYLWSALSNGAVVSFDPRIDVLAFNDPGISAAFVGVDLTQATRTVFTFGGKAVSLQTAPASIATSNVTFANGSVLAVGDNLPANVRDNGSNFLAGTAGADLLAGLGGPDAIDGGVGADTLFGDFGGSVPVPVLPVLPAGAIVNASTNASGLPANAGSAAPALSLDGRFVAFQTAASNLLSGGTNFVTDILVKDLQTGALVRANTNPNGFQANFDSFSPSLSADGRFVAFQSGASNLVSGDTNFITDIFVKDLQTGGIVRASTNASGVQAMLDAVAPSLSADGRLVAFQSAASNLVPSDTNVVNDIFVKDVLGGGIVRASVSATGAQTSFNSTTPALSADGHFVAFQSAAPDLVPGDTNFVTDVFVKNLQTGAVFRASTDVFGVQGNFDSLLASLSSDGALVAFQSAASNLVPGDQNFVSDIFVKSLQTGAIGLASIAADGTQANAPSDQASISADGRFVAFRSFASNLVPLDTNGVADIFVKDLQTGAIALLSTSASGQPGNDASDQPVLSADGAVAAFQSGASNLVTLDTNAVPDVFAKGVPIATTGTAGSDDVLRGGPGNDFLDGGEGTDLALFNTASAGVAIFTSNGVTGVITPAASGEGTDQLVRVEQLGFTDRVILTPGDNFASLEYIASYTDLSAAFGANAQAGFDHFLYAGFQEGRQITFDGLEYIASYPDLIAAFDASAASGATHFITTGRAEGRSVTFDGLEYIASYSDLIVAFGTNSDAGTNHFIATGHVEGRSVSFDGLNYIASYGDLIDAFGANADAGAQHFIVAGSGEHRVADFNAAQYLNNYSDLQAAFDTDLGAATQHFILAGYHEGRTDQPLV